MYVCVCGGVWWWWWWGGWLGSHTKKNTSITHKINCHITIYHSLNLHRRHRQPRLLSHPLGSQPCRLSCTLRAPPGIKTPPTGGGASVSTAISAHQFTSAHTTASCSLLWHRTACWLNNSVPYWVFIDSTYNFGVNSLLLISELRPICTT